MNWPPSCPDLNSLENPCSVKMKLYEGGKQYDSTSSPLKTIITTMSEIKTADINNNKING